MEQYPQKENKIFRYSINSIENAFSLLEVLAEYKKELGLTELCKKTSLPKGTVHRLLGTLKKLNYVTQNSQNHKYFLTFKFFKLTNALNDKISIEQITPYMRELSQRFNEAVSLAILDKDEIIYLYSVGSNNTLKLDLKIGSHQPAYCAALGRVLLANLSESTLNDYLNRIDLKAYTPYTITIQDHLKKELQLVKQQGYSVVSEEYILGVSCVAVPLKDYLGKVCAGLSFSIPTVRMEKERLPLLTDALLSIAQKVILEGF